MRRLLATMCAVGLILALVACDPQKEAPPDTAGWTQASLNFNSSTGECSTGDLEDGNYVFDGTGLDCTTLRITGGSQNAGDPPEARPENVWVKNVTITLDTPPDWSDQEVGENLAIKATWWEEELRLEGIRVHGPYIYEGINVIGLPGATMLMQDVGFADPVLGVRKLSSCNGNPCVKHNGGDVFQTIGGELAELRVRGFSASANYQGFVFNYPVESVIFDGVLIHHLTYTEWVNFTQQHDPPEGTSWIPEGGPSGTDANTHYWPGTCKFAFFTNVVNPVVDEVTFDTDDVVVDYHSSIEPYKPYEQLTECDLEDVPVVNGEIDSAFPS